MGINFFKGGLILEITVPELLNLDLPPFTYLKILPVAGYLHFEHQIKFLIHSLLFKTHYT